MLGPELQPEGQHDTSDNARPQGNAIDVDLAVGMRDLISRVSGVTAKRLTKCGKKNNPAFTRQMRFHLSRMNDCEKAHCLHAVRATLQDDLVAVDCIHGRCLDTNRNASRLSWHLAGASVLAFGWGCCPGLWLGLASWHLAGASVLAFGWGWCPGLRLGLASWPS